MILALSISDESPCLEHLSDSGDGLFARLVGNISYLYKIDGTIYRQTIKSGFILDGASIPRFAWAFGSPFTGRYLPAAIKHDADYGTHFHSFDESNDLFYQFMRLNGVGSAKAWIMRKSVGAFGGSSFEKSMDVILENRKLVELEIIEHPSNNHRRIGR